MELRPWIRLTRTDKTSVSRPDLILLDLNLPRKNGQEVLAEIKSSPDLKQIPVLVITSSSSDEDVSKAYSLNANCYIAKPYNLADYVRVIRAIEEFWFFTATLPAAMPGILPRQPQTPSSFAS